MQKTDSPTTGPGHVPPGAIVYSHVRWDSLWQRPQHIAVQMNKRGPVLFVEAPVYTDDAAVDKILLTAVRGRIIRALCVLSATRRNQPAAAATSMRDLLRYEISKQGRLTGMFDDTSAIVYEPGLGASLAGRLAERAIAYDCVTDWNTSDTSSFERLNNGNDTDKNERILLGKADVVFASGPSLFDAYDLRHKNVQLLGSGVDHVLISRATMPDTSIPMDAKLVGPVAGYFGTIDSRLDFGLIASLAQTQPDLNILLIGAVSGKEALQHKNLSSLGNIHWLGVVPYDELPRYAKACDILLMPFRCNTPQTRFLSPAIALQYLSTGKPVIATDAGDIRSRFGQVLPISRTPEEFIQLAWKYIDKPELSHGHTGQGMADRCSWEHVSKQISGALDIAKHAWTRRTDHWSVPAAETNTNVQTI